MDRIYLDDLVLQNCALHMDFIGRIAQEVVSRRFASALRSANKECQTSISIRHDEVVSAENVSGQFRIIIECGSKSVDWHFTIYDYAVGHTFLPLARYVLSHEASELESKDIAISVEKIHWILLEIFSRFKHFNRLKFQPCSEWVQLSIVFLNLLFMNGLQRPVFVKQLIYSTGGYSDAFNFYFSSFKIAQHDCELIEALAPSLEEFILLVGELPSEGGDLSHNFWTAMSNCHSLRKLYLARTCRAPYLFLNSDMHNFLKTSNIREFHVYESNDSNLNADWICNAFKDNKNLRKLYINNNHIKDLCNLSILSDPAVLPIIARLRSLEIVVLTHNDNEVMSANPNIRKILQALPEHAYINVEQIISLQETASTVEADFEAAKVLAFWIRLSHEMKKPVRLYARTHYAFHHATKKEAAISQKAIDGLAKQEEFAGIKIEHRPCRSRTIIHFNEARIALYHRLLVFKPYLTAEYAGCHHMA